MTCHIDGYGLDRLAIAIIDRAARDARSRSKQLQMRRYEAQKWLKTTGKQWVEAFGLDVNEDDLIDCLMEMECEG